MAIVVGLVSAVNFVAPYFGPWPVDPIDPAGMAIRIIGNVLWWVTTLLALSRGSTVRLGWLLVWLAVADEIWAIQFIPVPAFYYVWDAWGGLEAVVIAHVLVAFPTGSLRSRFDRRLVGGLYLYLLVGGAIRLVVNEPGFECAVGEYCPRNPFAILPNAEFTDLYGRASSFVVPVLGLLVLAAIARHWRAAGPAARRVLRPVVIAAPFIFVYQSGWYVAHAFELTAVLELLDAPITILTSWLLPGAFLIGVLRARATTAALPGAVIELGNLPSTLQLESVLRRRLGDPDLQVVRWSNASGTYLDAEGRTVEPPAPGSGRRLIGLERDGIPVAAVVLDAALDDPGLATTITGLVRLTVDATDLRDELRFHGGDVGSLPTGEVTFLFADIEGSTAILEDLGDRYAPLLSELRRLASEVIDRHAGRVVDARADELFAAFADGQSAAIAAIELEERIAAASWPAGASPKLRIGLHTGRPELTPSGYVGIDVHRAARVMAAAHGGQVVATTAVLETIGPGSGVSVRPLGRFRLRGLSEPTAIVQLDRDGQWTAFPPLRAEASG